MGEVCINDRKSLRRESIRISQGHWHVADLTLLSKRILCGRNAWGKFWHRMRTGSPGDVFCGRDAGVPRGVARQNQRCQVLSGEDFCPSSTSVCLMSLAAHQRIPTLIPSRVIPFFFPEPTQISLYLLRSESGPPFLMMTMSASGRSDITGQSVNTSTPRGSSGSRSISVNHLARVFASFLSYYPLDK